MDIFRRMKLRQKLLLLISLPLTLVFIYAINLSLERQQELHSARDVTHIARATDLLSIVHRLQFERGKAVAYASDRKSKSFLEWRKAVEQSKEFAVQLPELRNELENINSNQIVIDTLVALETDLSGVTAIREQIESNQVFSKQDILSAYSDVINHIHVTVSKLSKLAPGSELFQLADAISVIAELKEVQGLLRADITSILNSGRITESDLREVVTLNTKDKLLSREFLSLAPIQFQEEYLRLGFDGSGAAVSNVVQNVIDAGIGTKITGDAEQWFANATQRINQLRDVEKNLNQALVNHAKLSRDEALTSLVTTILIAFFTIGTVSLIAWIATGKLAEGFMKLRDSAVEFTDSGEFKTVPIESHDELGEVAVAFNHLIDQLRLISSAVEAVANGDFEQHVEVKSDRDRLALSLNHMIRTLRESVDRMQTENWQKSGQSELSERINSDQCVQDLAQKAITYLAEYLNSPVAAIYLLDKNETAELCASYAYTHRKELRNRFSKGESLVGQAVLERKPIVIDQLPPDYIQVSSGLGNTAPTNVVVMPLIYTGKVIGVLELGTLRPLKDAEFELLNKSSDNLAVALHAASSRERLAELLEETQAQSEELQSQQQELEQTNTELEQQTKKLQEQQEELEQANSELEEQTQQLEESQQELRTQKQQLAEANDELTQKSEELQKRNRDIEARSEELETARKTLEVKAKELASASKYKSEFLANMSHELRTPLNSLLLLAQSLKDNDDNNLSDQQVEALKIIYGSGSDLLTLINDILDLSKVEAGKLSIVREELEIAEFTTQLESQFKPLAKDKNLELRFDLAPTLPATIFTDGQRLQQILRNLLGNAIKFTEKGFVALNIRTNKVMGIDFIVKDSGIGVPPKLQNAIFEAFQQGDGSTRRKYSGTGLGLTISRELAHLLGGDIQLQSSELQGSEFTLTLPAKAILPDDMVAEVIQSDNIRPNNVRSMVHSDEARQDIIKAPNTLKAISEMSPLSDTTNEPTDQAESDDIKPVPEFVTFVEDDRDQLDPSKDLLMIIEDDLVFAKCLMELAHTRQFQCIIAADVSSGVEMATFFKPSAIVLDMVLPDGSGEDVINQLKANPKTEQIPIHVVSSLDLEDIKPSDSIGVLTKPISKESIDKAFRNIVRHLHQGSQRRILVIEDDRNTRKTIELLLEKRGLNIIHAGTGKEGLNILKEESIDCVILDLTLPDMDSVDILKQIAGPDVEAPLPVIIYTGRDLGHEEYKKLRSYTDHIIIKGNLAQERLLNDVTLFLHSVQPKKKAEQKTEPEKMSILKGKKVLIVDDDMRNTFALANLLKRNGMEVVMADNGSLALDKLNERDDIELAIMDIMMPVMDGYEAIRKIRERSDYKDLPIIALTAKAMPEDRDKCLQVGANDYLAKPVDSERLLSAIKMWGSTQ